MFSEEPVRCANCDVEIRGTPVWVDGKPYCCQGCAAVDPCTCPHAEVGNIDALISQLIRAVADLRRENKELRGKLKAAEQKSDFYRSQMEKSQNILGLALEGTQTESKEELPPEKPSMREKEAISHLVEAKPNFVSPGQPWELVVSGVHSFFTLVGLENWLREADGIGNFTIRNFQDGVATIQLSFALPERWEVMVDRFRTVPGLEISAVNAAERKIEGRLRD